jgi:hypothetical protein
MLTIHQFHDGLFALSSIENALVACTPFSENLSAHIDEALD